ncbi:MAG TPA: YicC/YloC family endoribonuclease [Stellaceae bacterium]|nr:YicC/YloC family endoribonuclease [Stellaceae bacterium]
MPTASASTPIAKLGTIASMTGFARSEGEAQGLAWTWEIKSVNGKSLDLRFRLPPGLDALELPLRALLAERLKRGSIGVNLVLSRSGGGGGVRVNRAALEQVLTLARELAREIDAAPPSVDGLLALRGVLDGGEEELDPAQRERREAALLASSREAIEALGTMRRAEGARLGLVLAERLGEIARLVGAAESSAAAQPEALRERLRLQIAALVEAVPAIPEERLAQEAALLVSRGDIREELDRLTAHVAAARELLAEGGAIGRRLDFLCQEFNREANTLCSKSAEVELTRIGLALKAATEQFREQVQNIE